MVYFILTGNSFEQSLPVGTLADLEVDVEVTPSTTNGDTAVRTEELELIPVEV